MFLCTIIIFRHVCIVFFLLQIEHVYFVEFLFLYCNKLLLQRMGHYLVPVKLKPTSSKTLVYAYFQIKDNRVSIENLRSIISGATTN
jgi:hypothetical protein